MAEESEKTDYVVVGVVGGAAIIAIIAMAAFTFPSTSFTFDASVTGRVVDAPVTTPVQTPRVVQVVSVNPYDYDGDGTVGLADSRLLSEYILAGSCMSGYDCDVNDDGVLDKADLGVFNARLIARQRSSSVTGAVAAQSAPRVVDRSLPVLSTLG